VYSRSFTCWVVEFGTVVGVVQCACGVHWRASASVLGHRAWIVMRLGGDILGKHSICTVIAAPKKHPS